MAPQNLIDLINLNLTPGTFTTNTEKLVKFFQLLHVGTGSPNNVVVADVGSTYLRLDGGAGTTLYVKESGSGSSGWVGHGSGGAGAIMVDASTFTGVDKTGATDSTAGIITALAAAAGKTLFFPAGTYVFDTGALLIATAGTVIRGAGVSSTVFKMKNAAAGSSLSNAVVKVTANNVTLADFTIDGNKANNVGGPDLLSIWTSGVSTYAGNAVIGTIVKDVVLRDGPNVGLYTTNSSLCVFHNVTALRNGLYGFYENDSVSPNYGYNRYIGCHSEANLYGYEFSGGYGGQVIGCSGIKNTAHGAELSATSKWTVFGGNYSDNTTQGMKLTKNGSNPATRNIIVGVTTDGNGDHGNGVWNGQYNVFSGCRAQNNGYEGFVCVVSTTNTPNCLYNEFDDCQSYANGNTGFMAGTANGATTGCNFNKFRSCSSIDDAANAGAPFGAGYLVKTGATSTEFIECTHELTIADGTHPGPSFDFNAGAVTTRILGGSMEGTNSGLTDNGTNTVVRDLTDYKNGYTLRKKLPTKLLGNNYTGGAPAAGTGVLFDTGDHLKFRNNTYSVQLDSGDPRIAMIANGTPADLYPNNQQIQWWLDIDTPTDDTALIPSGGGISVDMFAMSANTWWWYEAHMIANCNVHSVGLAIAWQLPTAATHQSWTDQDSSTHVGTAGTPDAANTNPYTATTLFFGSSTSDFPVRFFGLMKIGANAGIPHLWFGPNSAAGGGANPIIMRQGSSMTFYRVK